MARRRKNRYVFATDRRPHRVRRFFATLGIALLLLAAVGGALSFGISHEVSYVTQWVTVAKLPADLEQFSILHLSDLHGVTLGSGQAAIRRVLSGQRFSCCVMTGDMLGPEGELEPLAELIGLLPEGLLTVYIPGDEDPPYLNAAAHGNLSPKADWAEKLESLGVTVLDEPLLIERGRKNEARLWLIPEELYALDLDGAERTFRSQLEMLRGAGSLTPDQAAAQRVAQYQVERLGRIREKIKQIAAGDIQVVLSHTPLTEDYARTLVGWSSREDVFSIRQAALVLAGHFCGGPFRLPWAGPVYVPEYGWFPAEELVSGMSWPGGVPQYISPGLGANRLCAWQPFRLFNHPTVTKIYLTARTSH